MTRPATTRRLSANALTCVALSLGLAACTIPTKLGNDDSGSTSDTDGEGSGTGSGGLGQSNTGVEGGRSSDAGADSAWDDDDGTWGSDGESDAAADADDDDDGGDGDILDDLCASLVAESGLCIVTTDPVLFAVGLDSGDMCALDVGNEFLPWSSASMVWRGEYLYACAAIDEFQNVARYHLPTGTIELGAPDCVSVASSADAVYYLNNALQPTIHVISDLPALFDGGTGVDTGVAPLGIRMVADAESLWVTPAQSSSLEVFSLLPVEPSAELELEGHTGWIHGMSRLEDELVIARDAAEGIELAFFDVQTGDLYDTLALTGLASSPSGVACRSGDRR